MSHTSLDVSYLEIERKEERKKKNRDNKSKYIEKNR
jgi:hypothetical protein